MNVKRSVRLSVNRVFHTDVSRLESLIPSALLPAWTQLRHRMRPRFYAQDGEDKIVSSLLGKVNFFIDIGANDGITQSNTFRFALAGASGVCFEPASVPFKRLQALYRSNPRVTCRNCAISDRARETELVATPISGLSHIPETADSNHHRMIYAPYLADMAHETVQVLPFDEAIAGCNVPSVVDLLSIDVEGHELNVLKSVPFDRFCFRAIVLETHIRDEWRHRDYDQIVQLLLAAGYAIGATTSSNTIFVAASSPLRPAVRNT